MSTRKELLWGPWVMQVLQALINLRPRGAEPQWSGSQIGPAPAAKAGAGEGLMV